MNRLILISAVCMQFGWISGAPNPAGVGAYAYQDSDGNRYGGTYGLRDDQVSHHGNFNPVNPVPFGLDFDDFFPEYFRNFENLLQEVQFLYPIPSQPLPLPPLKPLLPFRPLQFQPLKPLQPLSPLRPFLPFQPLQLLSSYSWQTFPPPPSSADYRTLESLGPERPLQPLWPLQPLPPLQLIRLLQPLRPLQSLRPLQPPRPVAPLWNLQSLQPLQLQPSLLPLRLPRFSTFHPWRLYRPLPPLGLWLPFLRSEAFKSNKEYQKKALESAKKAYDITSNQAGFMNFDFSRYPFNGGFGNFGMPNFGPQNFGPQAFGGQNSAFASGSAMPGYSHQIAAISPANPNQPNVDIKNRFGEDTGNTGNGGYMSVSSSSYASSSNVNGQEQNRRGAETVVNNNGVVRRYKVES